VCVWVCVGKHTFIVCSHQTSTGGQKKARVGRQNGQCKRDPDEFHTWQPIDVGFEALGEMLERLHDGRVRARARPWLRQSHLPELVTGAKDKVRVMHLMNDTTIGHPDRYMDAVSVEVLSAMASASSTAGAESVIVVHQTYVLLTGVLWVCMQVCNRDCG